VTRTFSEYDAAVAQLMSLGKPRILAEQLVREQLPHLAPATLEAQAAALERTREKEEQAECVKIYRAHGCLVYSTSQYRPSKVSAGIPDLLVFSSRVHAFWFHEVKRAVGGEQAPAQREFQEYCEQCRIRYVLGDRSAAWSILRETGVIPTTQE